MAQLVHAIDIHSFEPRAAEVLGMNEIGLVDLVFDKPLVATDYQASRELGSFILIDRMTNHTVALGVIDPEASAEATNAWARTLRRIGGVFGVENQVFWQAAISRVVAACILGGLVFALSDDVVVAAAAAAGEAMLYPALRRLVQIVWPVASA